MKGYRRSPITDVIALTVLGLTIGTAIWHRLRPRDAGGARTESPPAPPIGWTAATETAPRVAVDSGDGSEKEPLRSFFLLVFLLSVPFWLIGGNRLPVAVNLPASALGTFNPLLAAAILTYRRRRMPGVKALLRSAVDVRKVRGRAWYGLFLGLMPFTYLLSYLFLRLSGMPLPEPSHVSLATTPRLLLMYVVGATGEELGWTAYATERLQRRWGALRAALILGVVWAIWHTIPYKQTGNSARWIVWQSLGSVARRVLLVWTYNKSGGSVFATILVHATDNASWSLFPNDGSHYNPAVTTAITIATAALVWRLGDDDTPFQFH